MTILGIESSCDETSAAVYNASGLLSNIVSTQAIHKKYGGVVPEFASRAHEQAIWPTVEQALSEAGIKKSDIDGVAVANGPGLMGALLVGLSFAKGFALSNKLPIIGVNHMEAHVYANFIEDKPEFPFLCLTVSGGHTQIEYIPEPFAHQILGKTRDDAAGEAFDKIGKIFGLPYPAGPVMDKLSANGDPEFHRFPRALMNEGFDFSFSGLKTSALYHLESVGNKDEQKAYLEKNLSHLCASVSNAITDALIRKTQMAIDETGVKTLLLAGGVSANSMLRAKSAKLAKENGLKLFVPRISFCTDNAAMIAVTGYMKAKRGLFDDMSLKAYARM